MDLIEKVIELYNNIKIITLINNKGEITDYTFNPLLGEFSGYAINDKELFYLNKEFLPINPQSLSKYLKLGVKSSKFPVNSKIFDSISSVNRDVLYPQSENPYRFELKYFLGQTNDLEKIYSSTIIQDFILANVATYFDDMVNIGIIGATDGYLPSIIANITSGETVVFNSIPELENITEKNLLKLEMLKDEYSSSVKWESFAMNNINEIHNKYLDYFDVLICTQGLNRKNALILSHIFTKYPNSTKIIAPYETYKECDAVLKIPRKHGYDEIIKKDLCSKYKNNCYCLHESIKDPHIIKSFDYTILNNFAEELETIMYDVDVNEFEIYS